MYLYTHKCTLAYVYTYIPHTYIHILMHVYTEMIVIKMKLLIIMVLFSKACQVQKKERKIKAT